MSSRLPPACPQIRIASSRGDLYRWAAGHVPPSAQAVVVGGNGLRAVGVIEALEAELGRPVLTANQMLLWGAMAAAGAQTGSISGYGRLFAVIPSR